MKVLHIEAGKNLYGGALQVSYLLQGLADVADDVESVLICPQGCELANRAQGLAKVYPLIMKGDADFKLKSRIKKVIQEEKPDLIHIHSRRGADIWGTWAAKMMGVPAICSRRVDNPEPSWLAKFKYRQFARVVTISQGIKQVLLRQGVPEAHVECVHSAVDTTRFTPDCSADDLRWFRAEFDLTDQAMVIANFAQMIERKGQADLITAFSSIAQQFPHAVLMLFGKGAKMAEYQLQVNELQLQDRVRFPGFRDDIERILPCVDIVAHPASMEGLGVALLQSAACCKPIVATRAGGIPEIVVHNENGFLLEPGDCNGIASFLSELLADNTLREKMGKAGRRRVIDYFSINAMALGNRRVYQKVLENSA